MNLEVLRWKAGKGLILGFFTCLVFFTLMGCKKDVQIKQSDSANQNHIGVDPQSPSKDTLSCGGFRTQTQGGWGAAPHGNNPGSYLYSHFAGAFPNGLTVGCTYKITLTSAQAITNYLPGGGTPSVLNANYMNPTNLKNNLASQLITLTLSVQFDLYDPNFSSSSLSLGNLLIANGVFKGMKITDVLMEANKVLGGCPSAYTANQVSDVLTSINENFDDGTSNKGFLVCPDKIVVTFH